MTPHRPPTPEQSEAVAERGIDVFLQAGAGTGKTSVLVDRYVAALTEDDVGIEGVLAFTFTDRAAEQLRRRIRAALDERARRAAEGGDQGRHRALRDLAREADRAWISTIHAFCRRLLAAHPAAAGIDPRFRVIEEAEAGLLASRAFEEALERTLAGPDSAAAAGLVAAARPWGLRSMVRTAYDELRSRGEARPALPPLEEPDPVPAIAELAEAAEEALVECAAAVNGGHRMLDRLAKARKIADPERIPSLDQVIPLELDSKAKAFAGECAQRYRRAHAAARRALAEIDLGWGYEVVRDLLGAFGERYEELKHERSGLDFEDLQLRAVALLRSSPSIRDTLRERFRHLLVDEFQDTNLLQLSLLRELQGPEGHLFCVGDEFQSIYGFRHADLGVYRSERRRFEALGADRGRVLPLTGNFRSSPAVLAAVNVVGEALLDDFTPLTVGSERQGEDGVGGVELLLTAAGGWDKEGVGLEVNPEEPSPHSRVAEARLLASRLRELCDEGGEEIRPGDVVVLLRAFTHVEAFERALAEVGLDPYVVGGRGYWSQQQVEDLRALLGVIANPLDEQTLLGALASPACGALPDTLWLLRKVAGGGRLWHALRAVADGDAPEDEERRSWFEAVPPEEAARLRLFRDRVEALRDKPAMLGLEPLIERCCEDFGYDVSTLMRDRGRARWANVRKLMRLAREFERHEGRDLPGFLAYLEEESIRAREGEAATAAEEHDGVRIMTVHNAKGLEYPVVAVADLGRSLLAGGRRPLIRIDRGQPPSNGDPSSDGEGPSPLRVGVQLARLGGASERLYDYLELTERAEREESEEALRLAYVAATRAKRRLILSGVFNEKRGPGAELKPSTPVTDRLVSALSETGLGELLATGASGQAEIELPAVEARPGLDGSFDPDRMTVRVSRPGPGAAEALSVSRARVRAEPLPAGGAPPLIPDVAGRPGPARLSYSALSDYARCGYRFYVERVLGLAGPRAVAIGEPELSTDAQSGGEEAEPEPTGDEMAAPGEIEAGAPEAMVARRYGFGNAVHRLLEWSARRGWAAPDRERCARALSGEHLPASDQGVERAARMIAAWLDSPLCRSTGQEGGRIRPETSFILPADGALIRGSIDLLVAPESGPPLIIDYKTDALGGEDPASHMDRYQVQRAIYALAVARASGAQTVRTAYVFLERAADAVEEEFGPERLADAATRIDELLAGIDAERFEVTPTPHAALCAGCPARERLCSHPWELTGRALLA